MIRREDLEAYQARPTPEGLTGLLRACADPVYNVCFQVLRQRQDAEDAAQEVLLKTVEQLRGASDIRQFDRWMYRVAVNTALNRRKREARRTVHEHRGAAMTQPEPAPEGLRVAVCEALRRLDDDSRCVLVRHFFEGRSLRDLSAERGCSTVAVWRRIDRAKQALRKALVALGVTAGAVPIDSLLASIEPVPAPPMLVSEALLSKVLLASGGVVMAAKGVSIAAQVAVCIALFVVGAGGGVAARSLSGSVEDPIPTIRTAAPALVDGSRSAPALEKPAPLEESLAVRLAGIGTLLREARKLKDPALHEQLNELWAAAQPVAYRETDVLFGFLRDSANRDLLEDLLFLTLGYSLLPDVMIRSTISVPKAVLEGLARMLSEGSSGEKVAVARLITRLRREERLVLVDAALLVLSTEHEPMILCPALAMFQVDEPPLWVELVGQLEVLQSLWRRCDNRDVRGGCLETLAAMKSPAAETLLIENLEEALRGPDPQLAQRVTGIIARRLESAPLGEETRYAPLLQTALVSTKDEQRFRTYVNITLQLPPEGVASVYQAARDHSPTPAIRARLDRVVAMIRAGETRADVFRHVTQRGR